MNADKKKAENPMNTALAKLNASLEKLEFAVDSRQEKEVNFKDAAKEAQRMAADRTRLANSLDDAEARAKRLADVNREVSNRLVNSMETVRKVLDS